AAAEAEHLDGAVEPADRRGTAPGPARPAARRSAEVAVRRGPAAVDAARPVALPSEAHCTMRGAGGAEEHPPGRREAPTRGPAGPVGDAVRGTARRERWDQSLHGGRRLFHSAACEVEPAERRAALTDGYRVAPLRGDVHGYHPGTRDGHRTAQPHGARVAHV